MLDLKQDKLQETWKEVEGTVFHCSSAVLLRKY